MNLNILKRELVSRLATGGTVNQIKSTSDILQLDVHQFDEVRVHVDQIVADGTVVLQPWYTLDGTNWIKWGATIEQPGSMTMGATLFPAGNNAVVELLLKDSHGMRQKVKAVKLTCTTYTSGGSVAAYGMQVSGVIRKRA